MHKKNARTTWENLFFRVRGLFTRKIYVPERLHGLFEGGKVHVLGFLEKEVAFYPPHPSLKFGLVHAENPKKKTVLRQFWRGK